MYSRTVNSGDNLAFEGKINDFKSWSEKGSPGNYDGLFREETLHSPQVVEIIYKVVAVTDAIMCKSLASEVFWKPVESFRMFTPCK
jgi:hypothetical protein